MMKNMKLLGLWNLEIYCLEFGVTELAVKSQFLIRELKIKPWRIGLNKPKTVSSLSTDQVKNLCVTLSSLGSHLLQLF
jgi:hypothetical protein